MINNLLANFDFNSFAIGVAVTILVGNIWGMIVAQIALKSARKNVVTVDAKLTELKQQLKAKEMELDQKFSQGAKK